MLIPAVTAAAACSPSGSKNNNRRPLTFSLPSATASAPPSPLWGDGGGGGAPAGFAAGRLHLHDGRAAIHGGGHARILGLWCGCGCLTEDHTRASSREGSCRANCRPSTQTIAPVGQRIVASGLARAFCP